MIDELVENYIKKLASEKEYLIAKYLTDTGYAINDVCLVERETETGRVFYPDLKNNVFKNDSMKDEV